MRVRLFGFSGRCRISPPISIILPYLIYDFFFLCLPTQNMKHHYLKKNKINKHFILGSLFSRYSIDLYNCFFIFIFQFKCFYLLMINFPHPESPGFPCHLPIIINPNNDIYCIDMTNTKPIITYMVLALSRN